jgi:hypothetical protein
MDGGNRDWAWAARWALAIAAVDAALFFVVMAALEGLSQPAFGPPALLGALASAYQQLHWPLVGWVEPCQAALGSQGNLLQTWRTPLAQSIRLGLFCADSFLAAWLSLWLFSLKPSKARLRGRYLLSRMKERPDFSGGARARLEGGNAVERGLCEAAMARLEQRLRHGLGGWGGIIEARAELLGWSPVFGGEARLWRLLGQATLTVEIKGADRPSPQAVDFGRACYRRALELEPADAGTLAACLAWRLPGMDGEEAALRVLEPASPELQLRDLCAAWRRGEVGPAETAAALGARLPNFVGALWARAELLCEGGDLEGALARWKDLALIDPRDRRWRAGVDDCLQGLGRPPQALPPPPERPQPESWLWTVPEEAEVPQFLLSWAWVLGLLLPVGLLAGTAGAFHQEFQAQPNWVGRWVCQALISPRGQRIPIGQFPPVYESPLAEEACGYTTITELGVTAAFILRADRSGEVRLGKPLYSLHWGPTWWGVAMNLDGQVEPTRGALSGTADALVLRTAGEGVEMAVPGQTWHLLFHRDDQPPLPLDDFHGVQAADLCRTSGGSFMSLGDRGWIRLPQQAEGVGDFQGVNSDLQPPAEDDRQALAAGWSADYIVLVGFQAPYAPPGTCGLCSRHSRCGGR